MANVTLSTLSLEKLKVRVTAGGADPTQDTVQMAVTLQGAEPSVWSAASWTSVNGVYYATVLVGPGSSLGSLAVGTYSVWVKVTDTPEVPVLKSPDTLTVF